MWIATAIIAALFVMLFIANHYVALKGLRDQISSNYVKSNSRFMILLIVILAILLFNTVEDSPMNIFTELIKLLA